MYNDITGIILSGGKSTRMGENKSLLKIGEVSVIEGVVNLMQSIFSQVILITNTPQEYNFLSIPMFKDIYKYKGPLAGIHSGLTHSETEFNFIISCDIPLMEEQMIKYICDYKTNHPITVCRADGFVQQLAGKYYKKILPNVETSLRLSNEENRNSQQKKRKCKVLSLLDEVGAEIIDAEKLDFYKPDIFFNMNRPEDYEKIKNLMSAQT